MSERQEDIREAISELNAGENDVGDAESTGQADGRADSGTGAEVEVDAAVDSAERDPAASPRVRDESGRFARSDKTAAPVRAVATATQPQKATSPTASAVPQKATQTSTEAPRKPVTTDTIKPPQSLRPSFRESAEWSKLPENWRQEISRWEGTVKAGLQKAAEAEKTASVWREAVAPYEAHLRASGHEPAKAIAGLLQFEYQLRTAPAPQRNALAAQMLQAYGCDMQSVAAHMTGRASMPQPARQSQPQPDVSALVKQAIAEQLEAAKSAQVDQEIASFGESHEFFEDVRQDMGLMVQALEARGVEPSLEDVYNKAIALHPEIQQVIQQREAAKAATAAQATTMRQKAAATSLRSSPAATQLNAEPESRRDLIAEELRRIRK